MLARTLATLVSTLAMLAPVAHAETFDITFDAMLTTSSGPVFGGSGSIPVHVEFEIDTDAPGAVVVPSGTGSWNGPTLYGYQLSATTFSFVTVGGQTFTSSQVVARVPAAGYSAAIWFDAPLEDGATPNTWMFFSSGVGTFQFGGAGCGSTCSFYTTASATDYSSFTSATGPLTVTVSGGPQLTVEYAVPGETTMLKVSGAPPDRQVYFVTSAATGSGFCPPALGGQCLGLWTPVILGQATTNVRGDAWLVATVPATYAPGATVYFQAALPAGAASLVVNRVPMVVEAP
jgi:hypothetical protein